jgi:hypothetical protein
MIPHEPGWAEIHSTPVSFAWYIEHNCTLDGLVITAVHPTSLLSGTSPLNMEIVGIERTFFCIDDRNNIIIIDKKETTKYALLLILFSRAKSLLSLLSLLLLEL